MREILFRGKRRDNGEWELGNLIISPAYKNCVMIERRPEYSNTNVYAIPLVNPETVGQFTGLTDKNGKKIFEGDILGHDNVKGIVFYSDKSACYMLRWKNFDRFRKDFFKECKLADFSLFEYMEVIGNIHDNPELLGGGEGAKLERAYCEYIDKLVCDEEDNDAA